MKLEVNMAIEAELGFNADMRWAYIPDPHGKRILKDFGYTGKFVKGRVTAIDNASCIAYMTFTTDFFQVIEWDIAIEGHEAYLEGQWELPGFPKPIVKQKEKSNCTCGSDATYGKNNTCHSFWCDARR